MVDNAFAIRYPFLFFEEKTMRKIFLSIILLAFCCSFYAQNYDIERYLNIRSASSPTFSPDGKRVAFLTNITGTSQIWMIDANGGYPEQITAYQDNISFIEWSPNGIIFGKASGGDENTQFFWLSNDGADIKQLTDDPKVRHNFGAISEDGAKIFYTSNKRDKNWFDVYSMNLADGKEELLYQDDSSNFVSAVSDDNSKVIVSRSSVNFSLDNDLYLIDTKTKQAAHLTPHDEAATFSDVHFLDNNTIIFGTNQNDEFITLSRMDLTTKEITPKNKVLWDLDATAISRDDKNFAYTINREGFSQLYISTIEKKPNPKAGFDLNLITQNTELPANGIVGGLEFSKDANKLAFTLSSAKNPTDIWIYDLRTKKIIQLTKSSRSGIPQSSFVAPELIKYKSFDGREISAWYYLPNKFFQPKVGGVIFEKENEKTLRELTNPNVPFIVSVHGGPEGQERPGFNPLYQYYLSRGYAILATNVRGSTGYGKTFSHLDDVEKREDSVKDLAAAVEWLKTSGGADAKRIAVMGGSYGGYMTLASITLYPDLWAAAVDTVGIVNWESFLKNTSGYRRRQREVEYGMLDKDIDFLRKISPIAKVDKIKTPLFVIAGKNDPRVPYTEAEQVVKALKDRNAIVQYKLYDDEGHGVSKLKNRLELYPLVADFLDKYMK